uniref:Uncharacterized protein n=1 Tax=Solanum tuberosum TaxID=4113 RepID=M1DBN2_SOLTU
MQYDENEFLYHTSHSRSEIAEWNIDELAEHQMGASHGGQPRPMGLVLGLSTQVCPEVQEPRPDQRTAGQTTVHSLASMVQDRNKGELQVAIHGPPGRAVGHLWSVGCTCNFWKYVGLVCLGYGVVHKTSEKVIDKYNKIAQEKKEWQILLEASQIEVD